MPLSAADEARLKELATEVSALKNSLAANTNLKDRLARLDGHIRFEFDLTAQRLTYLAISESFLFSAYTVIQANYDPTKFVNNVYLQRVAFILPILGVALAAAALIAVIGAISMTRILKDERGALNGQSQAAGLGVDNRINSSCWQHKAGLVPAAVLPLAFLFGWLYIYLRWQWGAP